MDLVAKQAQVERLAEEILSERQLIVEYDRRRQEMQQALGLFRKSNAMGDQERAWLHSGTMFIKFGSADAMQMLREDLAKINKEIERCQNNVRRKTIELEEAEHGAEKARTKGLELRSVSQSEMDSFVGAARRRP